MKFYIRTEVPATQVWEYTIEAEDEDEARRMVEDGEAEPENYFVEDNSLNGSSDEPEITEIYEI